MSVRRALIALTHLTVVSVVLLLIVIGSPTTNGHAATARFRYDPATGHLTWHLATEPTILNFDVHYADGSQPFQSTFTESRPEYFEPRVVRCVEEAWFVYAGPHQAWPTSSVLASGEVEYCPASKV